MGGSPSFCPVFGFSNLALFDRYYAFSRCLFPGHLRHDPKKRKFAFRSGPRFGHPGTKDLWFQLTKPSSGQFPKPPPSGSRHDFSQIPEKLPDPGPAWGYGIWRIPLAGFVASVGFTKGNLHEAKTKEDFQSTYAIAK